jgi:hypothetical protein
MSESEVPAVPALPRRFEMPMGFFTVDMERNPVSMEMLKLISRKDVLERKYLAFPDENGLTAHVVQNNLQPPALVALYDGPEGCYSFRPLLIRLNSLFRDAHRLPDWIPVSVSFAIKLNPHLTERHPRRKDLAAPVESCAMQIINIFGPRFYETADRLSAVSSRSKSSRVPFGGSRYRFA